MDPRTKRKGRVPYGYAYEGAGVSGGTPAPSPLPLVVWVAGRVHLQDRGVSGGDETGTSWEPAAASSISTSKQATHAHASIEMVRGT